MTTMDETCWICGGAGGHHDCGEDTCCCLDGDDGGEFWRGTVGDQERAEAL